MSSFNGTLPFCPLGLERALPRDTGKRLFEIWALGWEEPEAEIVTGQASGRIAVTASTELQESLKAREPVKIRCQPLTTPRGRSLATFLDSPA